MTNTGRYEVKFILNERQLASSLSWLTKSTARNVYPERYVNSLYFDDVSFQSVRDNLAGISHRRKMRLRWYDSNGTNIEGVPNLELKYRDGRLGGKKIYSIPEIKKELLNMEVNNIFPVIKNSIEKKSSSLLFDDYYFPSLYVSYKREYMEEHDGLRITIDKEIKFHYPNSCLKLLQTNAIRYQSYILELKFPVELKNKVADMIRSLDLTPKRHSKYLVGLGMLGMAQYI
jgi:VTC domain-containing protein